LRLVNAIGTEGASNLCRRVHCLRVGLRRRRRVQGALVPAARLRRRLGRAAALARLTHSRVLGILKNPYAGAYVHGRYTSRRTVDPDGTVRRSLVERPRAEWPVLIKDHHEGYIAWPDYLANDGTGEAVYTVRTAQAVAERIGTQVVAFPGNHVLPGMDPAAFAAALQPLLPPANHPAAE
jgi:hypothetical protein